MDQEELRKLIVATANSIGANPVDLATAISYETGGSFDPLQRGPTTKWGQHKGLIQFGEPQARQFGVDWNDPLNSQLGENGAVAKYMKASGFKPGMSGLDLYSTINAGAPGRYNASDTAAGGAPGDVRAKWEGQMADHRAKAERLLDPYDTFADGPKGQEFYKPNLFGSMSPGGGASPAMANNSIDPLVAAFATGDEKNTLGNRLANAGKAFDDAIMPAPRPSAFPGGPSAEQAGGLLKATGSIEQLAKMLMSRRMS